MFGVPKSLSIYLAITDDQVVENIARSAVDETIGAMESEMQCKVRKGGLSEDRRTGELLYSKFLSLNRGLPGSAVYDLSKLAPRSNLVRRIPHSSRVVPHEERKNFVLDDTDLERELLRMTDAFTDELTTV